MCKGVKEMNKKLKLCAIFLIGLITLWSAHCFIKYRESYLREYPKEFNFALKERVRESWDRTCAMSRKTEGELGQRLCVHHIDYNKRNNRVSNLIPLSRSWNTKVSYNRKYWKRHFRKMMKERMR